MAEGRDLGIRALRGVATGTLLVLRARIRAVRLRIRHPLPVVAESSYGVSVLRGVTAGAGVEVISLRRAGGRDRSGELIVVAEGVNGSICALRGVAAGALFVLCARFRTGRVRIRYPLPVVAEGGNFRMAADPLVTGGAEDACGITDRCTCFGNRRAVFRGLVVTGVYAAVGGGTLGTYRFIHAVRRAAGAVLRGVFGRADTVGVAIRALAVVLAVADVLIRAVEIVPVGFNRFRLCAAADRAGVGLHARRCAGGLRGHRALVPRMALGFHVAVVIGTHTLVVRVVNLRPGTVVVVAAVDGAVGCAAGRTIRFVRTGGGSAGVVRLGCGDVTANGADLPVLVGVGRPGAAFRMVHLGGGDVAADGTDLPMLAAVSLPCCLRGVAVGGNRFVTADPLITGGAEDARRIAARRTGGGNRVAILRGFVVAGVYAAVSGVTFGTDRFVYAVGRAAGAVFRTILRCADTISTTSGETHTLFIMLTGTLVNIITGIVVTKGGYILNILSLSAECGMCKRCSITRSTLFRTCCGCLNGTSNCRVLRMNITTL